MIFGLDEYGKQIRQAAVSCGKKAAADKWLKLYKKVRKNVALTINHYHQVREDAQRILAEAREIEQYLSRHEEASEEEKTRMLEIGRDFIRTAPHLDYEFIISKADQEFHSTLQSAAKLAGDYAAGKADGLIFQSEIENLIYLTGEGLEKEKPDLFELAFFYLDHSDAELEEMSYSMRLEYVGEQYRTQFVEPILPVLTDLMKEALAFSDQTAGRKERKKAESLDRLRKTAERGLHSMQEKEEGPEALALACLHEITVV